MALSKFEIAIVATIVALGGVFAFSVYKSIGLPRVIAPNRNVEPWSIQRQLKDPNFKSIIAKSGLEGCLGTLREKATAVFGRETETPPVNGSGRMLIAPMTDDEKAKRLQVLRFRGNEPPGETYDNEDGTASINANLAETDFEFDGQDLWVRMREAPDYRLQIRGKFSEGKFLRIQGTELVTMRFLDADISLGEIQKLLSKQVSASNGATSSEIIRGRPASADYLNGGEGCDVFVFDEGYGVDTILMEKNTDAMPDLVMFGVSQDQVVHRLKPVEPLFKGDINLELIKDIEVAGKNRRYLTGDVLVIRDGNPDRGRKFSSTLAFQFADSDQLFAGVPQTNVIQIPLTRSEFELVSNDCEELSSDTKLADTAIFALDQFIRNNLEMSIKAFALNGFDHMVFSDNEIIAVGVLAKETEACDFRAVAEKMLGKRK